MAKSKKSGKRTFTVHEAKHVDGCPTKFSNKDYSGVYVSRTPAGAGKKALTQLCRVKRIKGQCGLFISMRETTQGSAKKIFHYKVTRVKLAKPVELAGRKIEYMNKIKKAKSMPACKQSRKSSGRKASRSMKASRGSKKSKRSMKSMLR